MCDSAVRHSRSMKSEPSKWLPVLLSLIAIGISVLSWREACQERIINEETNRPLLRLDDESHLTYLPITHQITFELKLKNIGETTSRVTNVDFKQDILIIEGKTQGDCFMNNFTFPIEAGSEILPGDELSLTTWIYTKENGLSPRAMVKAHGCENKPEQKIYAKINIKYSNPANDRRYSQTFDKSFTLTRLLNFLYHQFLYLT
jgi:hypothetical protein